MPDNDDDQRHDMLAIMDSFEPLGGDAPAAATPATRSLQWRSRYDGLVSVAYIDGKAVAGISGPWSGKYALTWWERPMPARELELGGRAGSGCCSRLRSPGCSVADQVAGLVDRGRGRLAHGLQLLFDGDARKRRND